MNCFA
ncbi:hypothetical protein A2U01_0107497, partial [Trifolium medium]